MPLVSGVIVGKLFADKLKQYRSGKGLSGRRLSILSGIDQGNLAHVESGRRPPSENDLRKIAAVPQLEIDFDTLSAWRKLDEMGEDGIELVKTYAFREFLTVIPGVTNAKFPPTEDEMELVDAATEVGVWTTELNNPELWGVPPDDRRREQVFEYVAEMIADARAYQARQAQ
jgi:transcriptional regulator with XRE-family HTH domain